MAIAGIAQPALLQIDSGLRLRRFDGSFAFALGWYQDPNLVYLVDGVREPYTMDKLERMYTWLDKAGELYFIEILQDGIYQPIGDVTFWQKDLPIVIGEPAFRGRGIGRKVIAALADRGRRLGYARLYVGEIYDFNIGSQKCFESVGFRPYEKTPQGARYVLELTNS